MRSGAGSARCSRPSADRLAGVIVQPVVTGGVEVRISVLHEQVAGPLVLFGLGGAEAMGWLTGPPGSLPRPTPTPTT